MSIRKRIWAAVPAFGLAAATTFVVAGPVQSASAAVPKVYASPTGSGTTCVRTTPCTLATAQTKALSFSTIVLAGGVYTSYSPVVAVPNLTMQGPKTGSPAVLQQSNAASPAPNASTPAGEPVSTLLYVGPDATNFTLANVTIDGSLAKLSASKRLAAIYVRSADATLDHVTTASVYPAGGFSGAQTGTNIYVRSDDEATANVTLESSNIAGYNKTGVLCADNGTTCTIDKTTVTGIGGTPLNAQNGIEFFGNAGTISRSTVQNNAYTGGTPQASGILIIDAVSGVVVTKNTVSNNDNQIYAYQDGGSLYTTTSANVQITKNTSNNAAAYDGISLASVAGAFVSQNKINTTGSGDGFGIGLYGTYAATLVKNTINNSFSDGIYVGGPGTTTATSAGNVITQNKVFTSGDNGLHADASSSSNSFSKNTSKSSGGWDVLDEGTSNSWSSTKCTTHVESSPSGLC